MSSFNFDKSLNFCWKLFNHKIKVSHISWIFVVLCLAGFFMVYFSCFLMIICCLFIEDIPRIGIGISRGIAWKIHGWMPTQKFPSRWVLFYSCLVWFLCFFLISCHKNKVWHLRIFTCWSLYRNPILIINISDLVDCKENSFFIYDSWSLGVGCFLRLGSSANL